MKLTQSAAKRVRPPASSNTLTTPAVKKARHGNTNEKTLDDKFMATPGSVSCFPRKYRDVNSTPITAIPMAMKFSSTTTSKKPARKMRNVIGITGVNSETRGVLECAIHAIDANVSSESGHRKARVVKSLDYAAGVTHLIVGKETRRTIKVLFAIARGAWIVSEGWAFSSLEKERWLPEEDFELTMFGNKQSRLHPESRQIFKGMKFFVGSNVEPSREWVFDSIASMTLEDDAKYSFAERPELEVPSSGVSAVAETKSGRAVVSNLEAQSTVLE
ncbi:hypothetical protein BBJ28_00024002 [Nothophytophthora sp. Chile5]|nr:hypothetical protein BBJ28_00024002 [Nothophytophthora sp. Chile5]